MEIEEIDEFRTETDHEIHMLKRYIEVSEDGLDRIRAQEKGKLEELKSNAEKTFLEVILPIIDHHFSFNEEFPMVMRYGHLIALYSFAEQRLRSICKEVGKRKNLANKLSGPYVRDSKKFLVNADTRIDKIGEWKEIDELAKVRNCIAHASGFVEEDDKPERIKTIVGNTSGLSLNGQNRILVEDSYVESTFELLRNLVSEILDILNFGDSAFAEG